MTPPPPGRTGHACAQCRSRKQKCGGFTADVKCRRCIGRKVRCSFQEEVMDLRHNPCLRFNSPQEARDAQNVTLSPSAAALIPALANLDGRQGSAVEQMAIMDRHSQGASGSGSEPTAEELSTQNQFQSLTSRIAQLERRLNAAQTQNQQTNPSPPRSRTSFPMPPEPPSLHDSSSQISRNPALLRPDLLLQPPATEIPPISPVSFPSSATYGFPSPPGAAMTDGPLKTLNRFSNDDAAGFETQDLSAGSVLTQAEAYVMFKLFFSHGHPNAPFLDVDTDSDPDRVRSTSMLLFLAILSVGARFWSAPSKTSCWLHPRYSEIIRLLDAEIMRVTLRPRQEDHKLETCQALVLCAHWMPLDISADRNRYRSRFSEAGAWHCMGLAIRWAISLEMEKSCCRGFQTPETVTRRDANVLRTMLYLIESDHYLALSSRRPVCLNTEPINNAIANFGRCQYVQSTDVRLMSLFKVAHCAHFTDCRPTTIGSVEAFDRYVQLVERQFTSHQNDRSKDSLSQHFPFVSLRWYRLSYTCAFLDSTDRSQWTKKALMWAVESASQILIHLSGPAGANGSSLDPDPAVVEVMSFAIDHHFVVISYAVFFLVNSWLRSFIDLNLNPYIHDALDQDPSTSFLFRLVNVAARTLEAASPPQGHLARRYVPLLRGMADIVASGNAQSQNNVDKDANNLSEQLPSLGEDLWDMWQQAGLEPINWLGLPDELPPG